MVRSRILPRWQIWVGLLVSAGMLVVLALMVDRQELVHQLRNANYLYLAPAALLALMTVWLRAERWRYLLQPVDRISPLLLLKIVMIANMINNVLPARVGEVVRVVHVTRRCERVRAPSAVATLGVERVYDGLALMLMGVVAGAVLWTSGTFSEASLVYRTLGITLMLVLAVGFLLALVVLTALASSARAMPWLEWLLAPLPEKLRISVLGVAGNFVDGLKTLNSPGKHLALMLYSQALWWTEVCVYLVLAYAFNLQDWFPSFRIMLAAIVLVTLTSNLVGAVPTSIGGIGPFEVVAQQTLVIVGVGSGVAAGYAVTVHLLALWLPVTAVGLALMLYSNIPFGRLVGDASRDERDVVDSSVVEAPLTDDARRI